ncbi:MAG: T9SS type A sorting domain-containing protein [Armatimonadetes bacterium]|nr:T9SS type A sorting domain-containing protein [Armatimonadota bacterium]
MKKTILLFIFVTFISSILFADGIITRGPDIGEFYLRGPTVTSNYSGLYYSTDFGETITLKDSISNFMHIVADITPGVLYYVTMQEALYISYNYGDQGSWQYRNNGVKKEISSGRMDGEIYSSFSKHSEDYGLNFITHSYIGYFGNKIDVEIDNEDDIGYVIVYSSSVPDSQYLLISYDNFENLELQKDFSFHWSDYSNLSRGYLEGELFLCNQVENELYFSNDYGENWTLKNTFSCPDLPIKSIVGGRQPGELYLYIVYTQLMGLIKHIYIFHSLDYGETFTIYHPFSYGPPAYYANFEADTTAGIAPLTVQFTDLSSGYDIQSWKWDFDNDGVIDSYEQNPEYTYQDTGYYSVRLHITIGGGIGEEAYALREDYIHVTDGSGAENYELEILNFELSNYPNPFNPETAIKYILPESIEESNILIYNIKGQLIETLPIDNKESSVNWKPKHCSSGIYFYKIENDKSNIKKMILIK